MTVLELDANRLLEISAIPRFYWDWLLTFERVCIFHVHFSQFILCYTVLQYLSYACECASVE